MKQTAVEWLATYLKGITSLNCDEVVEQAKAMEKEQIVNAFCVNTSVSKKLIGYKSKAEQYYNETFKQY